jgi:hypothetical protein
MYLSIDVGIKNLAYVLYDNNIVKWDILELCETNANKANMIDLGKKIYILFEETFTEKINEVIIENQIGPSAIRMKSIQGMITMYFIQRGCNVVYWNSGNKLRFMKAKTNAKSKTNAKKNENAIVDTSDIGETPEIVEPKTSYKERKKLSILITECIIKEKYAEYLELFTKHKKKDDLADCFLQLIDYLVKKNDLNENIYTNAINIKL